MRHWQLPTAKRSYRSSRISSLSRRQRHGTGLDGLAHREIAHQRRGTAHMLEAVTRFEERLEKLDEAAMPSAQIFRVLADERHFEDARQ